MSILVCGGAGYIGAHVVRLLRQRGDHVVVVDDLSSGKASRVGDATLVRLDVTTDEALMSKVVLLSDFLTEHPDQHSIPDPYYGESDAFEYVIELCEDACAEQLRQL